MVEVARGENGCSPRYILKNAHSGIEYSQEMTHFLKNIPKTDDPAAIYNHLESQNLDLKTQKHLLVMAEDQLADCNSVV